MLAVAQVAEPGLQRRGVVFLDCFAVVDYAGGAGDGRPATGGVQEGDVGVLVRREVVGLAGFGVCVEEEVDAARFLSEVLSE